MCTPAFDVAFFCQADVFMHIDLFDLFVHKFFCVDACWSYGFNFTPFQAGFCEDIGYQAIRTSVTRQPSEFMATSATTKARKILTLSTCSKGEDGRVIHTDPDNLIVTFDIRISNKLEQHDKRLCISATGALRLGSPGVGHHHECTQRKCIASGTRRLEATYICWKRPGKTSENT